MELQSLKLRYGIIGNSPGLNHALSVAVRVAPTDLSVLILGESGVGKEVFSQIIHASSPRKHSKFIAVNCGAIPEGTIDSELFGHEKGAFTGASDQRKGYFEVVNGGTIFLDEIGEMPLGTQSRLLRVLESGEFLKVGSSKVQRTNVRVVAATNVELRDAVQRGKFREDLYYRLNTVPIHIPPLRERKEDIYLLFRKFSVDFAERNRVSPISLDDEAKKILLNYRWPGNIRELKNISEQMSVLITERKVSAEVLLRFLPKARETMTRFPVLSIGNNDAGFTERELLYKTLFDMRKDLSDLKKITIQLLRHTNLSPDLLDNTRIRDYDIGFQNVNNNPSTSTKMPAPYRQYNGDQQHQPIILNRNDGNYTTEEYNQAEVVEESLSIADKERELIRKALKKHNGKRKDAASDLGISERTLYRKIKEYQIGE